jgi:hypothetical protein
LSRTRVHRQRRRVRRAAPPSRVRLSALAPTGRRCRMAFVQRVRRARLAPAGRARSARLVARPTPLVPRAPAPTARRYRTTSARNASQDSPAPAVPARNVRLARTPPLPARPHALRRLLWVARRLFLRIDADGVQGFFVPTAGAKTETECPTGSASEAGATVCTCADGSEMQNGVCTACPMGSAGTGGTCAQCPSDSSPNAASTTCTCSDGSALQNGQCAQCQPGSAGSGGTCTQCAAGSYSATAGSTTCTLASAVSLRALGRYYDGTDRYLTGLLRGGRGCPGRDGVSDGQHLRGRRDGMHLRRRFCIAKRAVRPVPVRLRRHRRDVLAVSQWQLSEHWRDLLCVPGRLVASEQPVRAVLSGLGWHWRDLYELCGGIVRGDRWVVGLHTGGCSTFLFTPCRWHF